ncbi:MAG: fumarylacetoacetate hydrolase family protein [Taibaiella sp.]|nr:fumarylacetoacetate hydrolase family protein [Taibaiella sp.]
MKLICIGRNYQAHAQELNNAVPAAPIIFFKPGSCINPGPRMQLNPHLGAVHYECELILKVHEPLPLHRKISSVREICKEWSLGIDFTAREIQDMLKEKRLPWELAKGFDQSAVIGKWLPIPEKHLYDHSFTFLKNGKEVQRGHLSRMIFNLEQMVNYCTGYFSVEAGDILFTGTPEGVGRIAAGDLMEGVLMGEQVIRMEVE